MKNGAEHTEWKPALGAKEIRYLGQCGNASEDHREARKVTETLRYGQQKGIRYFFFPSAGYLKQTQRSENALDLLDWTDFVLTSKLMR